MAIFEAGLADLLFDPDEGFGCFVAGIDVGIDVLLELFMVKEAPLSDGPCKMESQTSTWLSQDAPVGVK